MMQENYLLQMQEAEKWLRGTIILRHVNLTVHPNRIIGVVGDNGVGKTVLMKLMAGLYRPDKGKVIANVHRPSYILTAGHFFDWMKVSDTIQYYTDYFDDFDRERASRLLEQSGLEKGRLLNHLSRGQKERLCLILGLSRNCGLYLLDEPFDGIDPFFKKDMKRFLLENIAEGSSVVMATHLLKDLEPLFDEVLFVTGDSVWQLETEEIRRRYGKSVEQYYLEDMKHE